MCIISWECNISEGFLIRTVQRRGDIAGYNNKKQSHAHGMFSTVSLPEEECGLSLLLPPQQGQRQGLKLNTALMEGLILYS